MEAALKDAIRGLMKEIDGLPEPQRKAIAARVKEIRKLSGLRLDELEGELKVACNCGPQGEPGAVPIW